MAETKKKRPKFTSPAGSLSYPWLTTPDKKFESVYGAYKTKLLVAPDKAQPLIAAIDEQMQLSLAAARASIVQGLTGAELEKATKKANKLTMTKPPYATDDDTDNVVFSFSAAAGGVKKGTTDVWTRKIGLFAADLTPLPQTTKIGSGTTAKVSFEFQPHHIPKDGPGVKLALVAVQILKLVEWQSGTGAQAGFSAEEGFDSEAAEEAAEKSGTEDTAEAGEGKDF